jgi:hypothetical protein
MGSRAFLGEDALRVAIASALAALAAGCSSQPVACGGCGCNQDAAPPQKYDVTFEVCSDAGTDDAGGDAGDAGVCVATCDQACVTLKPASISGSGSCVSADLDAGPTVTAHCETLQGACLGRKLDGLRAPDVASDDPIAAFFARAAWLEAASVGAFRRLARELRAHGAPARLIATATACARDETRHARMMARLAKKHGAVVPRVEVEALGVRDLESIARENAVEGCVGETYGAALATWAAEHAEHEDVRAASRVIAPDEMRHAALGWAVHAWAMERLESNACDRVRAARDEAAEALGSDPLVAELVRTLWSRAA